jgi:hypothetical protein
MLSTRFPIIKCLKYQCPKTTVSNVSIPNSNLLSRLLGVGNRGVFKEALDDCVFDCGDSNDRSFNILTRNRRRRRRLNPKNLTSMSKEEKLNSTT